ncbi:hypothetical protein EVAR_45273_1 [Eumeta japonica]|uniref:Uncharacterized protein n=1 Tax=Eumeta variegata TaxID=151549 RepID=A0A4C1XDH9_EUMVA|nr:hypothetical protein EVAR_45273_1 [Eumeta japonica]
MRFEQLFSTFTLPPIPNSDAPSGEWARNSSKSDAVRPRALRAMRTARVTPAARCPTDSRAPARRHARFLPTQPPARATSPLPLRNRKRLKRTGRCRPPPAARRPQPAVVTHADNELWSISVNAVVEKKMYHNSYNGRSITTEAGRLRGAGGGRRAARTRLTVPNSAQAEPLRRQGFALQLPAAAVLGAVSRYF